MPEVLEFATMAATHTVDEQLIGAIQGVFQESPEPLTLTKICSRLPARLRQLPVQDVLHRQVAAQVWHQYPPYRSQQPRYWDRPMSVHVVALLRGALANGPLSWAELRRKLPVYAQVLAENVLCDQVAAGLLFQHPRRDQRGGERFALEAADAKVYLREELEAVFARLEGLGFSRQQARHAALELLHEEEFAPPREPLAVPAPLVAGENGTTAAFSPAPAEPAPVVLSNPPWANPSNLDWENP
ncbi:MAG: hypothetical protein ACK4RK_10380 [Gemmataceae bacterium]